MYDYLIIDTVNLAYKLHDRCKKKQTIEIVNNRKKDVSLTLMKVGNRKVYRELMQEFITELSHLKSKFLNENGQVVLLFDNYTSRDELRASMIPATAHIQRKELNRFYKSNRAIASPEFYASIDLVHYWAKLKEPNFHTCKIFKLEADDLLPPCIRHIGSDKKILMVTNDSDWAKVMTSNIDMLPNINEEPFTLAAFISKKGYIPTEEYVSFEKMLYGDKADNVVAVFDFLTKDEKAHALKTYSNVVDFMYDSPSDKILGHHAIAIKNKERDAKLAYKMLSSVPVGDDHFRNVYTTGRNAAILRTTLEDVIFNTDKKVGMDAPSEFGRLLVPRKMPKLDGWPPISGYMVAWNNKDDEPIDGEKEVKE